MRKILLLCLLGIAVSAAGDQYSSVGFTETQACSGGACNGTAPSFSGGVATSGAGLVSVNGYRLSICAVAGQTLSGAGTMQAYWCDATTLLCYRDKGLDQAVTASGVRCATFPDFLVPYTSAVNGDTVEFVASGVTVSAGATITVQIWTHNERYK